MAQVTGPGTRQLAVLQEQFKQLPVRYQKPASAAIARLVTRLVRAGFPAKSDPYGQQWAPRKPRRRGGRATTRSLLVKSGAMRSGFRALPVATGVELTNPVGYTAFHQYGTRFMPRRQLVPEERTGGLGQLWGLHFNEEADRLLKKYLKVA